MHDCFLRNREEDKKRPISCLAKVVQCIRPRIYLKSAIKERVPFLGKIVRWYFRSKEKPDKRRVKFHTCYDANCHDCQVKSQVFDTLVDTTSDQVSMLSSIPLKERRSCLSTQYFSPTYLHVPTKPVPTNNYKGTREAAWLGM